MSVIDDLKPTRKALVMDLLSDAGFDVSDWKNYRGRAPAANPKYCYNWSFEQPGEAVAVCLWHDSLTERDGKIVYHRKPKAGAYKREPVGRMEPAQFRVRCKARTCSSATAGG